MDKRKSLWVGVDTVCTDFAVSRAKGYQIIRKLNEQLLEENPKAIVVAGKVNRIFYEEACLMNRN